MNRQQRRKFNKDHKTSYTKEEFEIAVAVARLKAGTGLSDEQIALLVKKGFAHMDNAELVPNGTEVRLNYDEISQRKREEFTDDYWNWIEANKDKVFHLKREENTGSLVCFEEDERVTKIDGEMVDTPSWLFDLYSDIMVQYKGEWVPVYKYDQLLQAEKSETAEENSDV